MKLCKETGKRKYRSKLDAMFANADLPQMKRAYPCEFCGMWHVTHQPKRQPRWMQQL